MSLSPDRAEAHVRDLARFQAIAMHAAEKAHAAIEATDDAQALCSLISAVSKAGRVLRMSIALEARLAHDADRAVHETEARDEARRERAVATRRAQVASAVERLIWTEREGDDAQLATADLAERLDDEALVGGFTDEPVEAQVERIAGLLGLTGEARGAYLPRELRKYSRFNRPFGRFDDAYDAYDDEDEEPDPAVMTAADPRAANTAPFAATPEGPAAPNPDPFNGRLAPPMDPPLWECDDDTS